MPSRVKTRLAQAALVVAFLLQPVMGLVQGAAEALEHLVDLVSVAISGGQKATPSRHDAHDQAVILGAL